MVARCPEGHPLVIKNAPRDADGTPFPTTYWLTCPAAVRAVSRLESAGAIQDLNERYERDAAFAKSVGAAHAIYAEARGGGPGVRGGVGGTARGIKCLHAHFANWIAGGPDPVGAWTFEHLEPYHLAPASPPVAVVDMGTNSIRLLVAVSDRGSLRDLSRDMVITRLGKGVDETRHLRWPNTKVTLQVLEGYVQRAHALGAERVRVGATSAIRDATNRDEFLASVRELTGSEPEVLSGEHEAALSFRGAVATLPDLALPALVMDTGGGSTEFVLGADAPRAAVSTQMGSVRLTERLVRADPPTAPELAAIAAEVDVHLDAVADAIPVRDARTFVAVAGTATTVAAIALDLPEYDPDRIHGTVLSLDDARAVRDRLAAMTTPERAALPVMAPGREDVIVAGAAILVRAMERFGFEAVTVSEHDILDGLALEALETLHPPESPLT